MASRQLPYERSLEKLPAMLNLVLVQTGKVLRDSTQHNLNHFGLTKALLKQVITAANGNFHDALDDIEYEILRAKAVVERDLSVIRRQRAERERKANISAAQKAAKQNRALPETDATVDLRGGEGPNGAEGSIGDDVIMLDAIEPDTEATDPAGAAAASEAAQNRQAISAVERMPQDSENSSGLAISIPTESAIKDQYSSTSAKNPAQSATSLLSMGDQPMETPKTNNFDFESMFTESEFATADGSLNFDLDFSTTDNSQALLGGSGFANITMTNPEIGNVGSTSNEDINSLLPGLENFVNEGTDTGTATVPAASTLPEASQTAVSDAINSAAAQASSNGPAAIDSAFVDFFTSGDFDTGEGNGNDDGGVGDGTGFGEIEEFNDDWFEM